MLRRARGIELLCRIGESSIKISQIIGYSMRWIFSTAIENKISVNDYGFIKFIFQWAEFFVLKIYDFIFIRVVLADFSSFF